jgi:transcriptional regulator with PAS, ATPase and Fis domain
MIYMMSIENRPILQGSDQLKRSNLDSAPQAPMREDRHRVALGSTILGKSPKILALLDLIARVSRSHSNILISGESGTGKEMVARAIHFNSDRSEFPFLAVNCAAIPDQLLESELFGHRKGSFTGADESRRGLFEEAEGGTLFLDEIGDMPLGLQAKLLRVLQERKVKPVGENTLRKINVRILSATHKNLKSLIQEKKFREDLYYRLSVIPIHLPPLRERKEDIPELVDYFMSKHCQSLGVPLKRLLPTALAKLMRMPWLGNVRELENTLERAIVLCESRVLSDRDIQIDGEENIDVQIVYFFSQLLSLKDLERAYIQYVLEVTGKTKERAAQILGIDRKTLYRKELEYEL